MLNRNDLELVLQRMQNVARGVDPVMARALVAAPRRNPDEPFLFEYLDRFVTALTKMIADPHEVARDELQMVLYYVRKTRMLAAEEWDMR